MWGSSSLNENPLLHSQTPLLSLKPHKNRKPFILQNPRQERNKPTLRFWHHTKLHSYDQVKDLINNVKYKRYQIQNIEIRSQREIQHCQPFSIVYGFHHQLRILSKEVVPTTMQLLCKHNINLGRHSLKMIFNVNVVPITERHI